MITHHSMAVAPDIAGNWSEEDGVQETGSTVHYVTISGSVRNDEGLGKRGARDRAVPVGLGRGLAEVPASFLDPLPDEILDLFEGRPPEGV